MIFFSTLSFDARPCLRQDSVVVFMAVRHQQTPSLPDTVDVDWEIISRSWTIGSECMDLLKTNQLHFGGGGDLIFLHSVGGNSYQRQLVCQCVLIKQRSGLSECIPITNIAWHIDILKWTLIWQWSYGLSQDKWGTTLFLNLDFYLFFNYLNKGQSPVILHDNFTW